MKGSAFEEVVAKVSNWGVECKTVDIVAGAIVGTVVKGIPLLCVAVPCALEESEVAPKTVVLPHVTILIH